MKPGFNSEATEAVLSTLKRLALIRSETYYSEGTISRNTPRNPKSYGKIGAYEVYSILDPLVDKGLVERVKTCNSTEYLSWQTKCYRLTNRSK